VEHFYIISGRIRVQLVDLDTGKKSEVVIREGQRVTIYPNCAHRFEAEEEAQVIEYYNSIYDPEDDIHYSEFE
jgi:mannose-6-phosphate isomerase-like protein (cupin superfamily)